MYLVIEFIGNDVKFVIKESSYIDSEFLRFEVNICKSIDSYYTFIVVTDLDTMEHVVSDNVNLDKCNRIDVLYENIRFGIIPRDDRNTLYVETK